MCSNTEQTLAVEGRLGLHEGEVVDASTAKKEEEGTGEGGIGNMNILEL